MRVWWASLVLVAGCASSFSPNEGADGGNGGDGGSGGDSAIGGDGGTALDCSDSGAGWTQIGALIDGDGTPGTDLGFAALAVGDTASPVVTWAEGAPAVVYTSRWDGSAWQALGAPFDISSASPGYAPEVIYNGDEIALAFIEENDASQNLAVFVQQWDGVAWSEIGGGAISTNQTNVVGHSMALDDSGALHVAWSEYSDGVIGRSRVHVKRITATDSTELLQELGGTTGVGASAITPFLQFDGSGAAVVAYSESGVHTYRRAGSDWTAMGVIQATGTSTTHTPRLGLDGARNPIALVAEFDSTEGASKGYAFEWNGASWSQLGGAFDELSGSQAHVGPRSIVADDMGRPVVAFVERIGVPQVLYVKRWDGAAWSDLGVNPVSPIGDNGNVISAELALDGCGRLNLALVEEDAAGNRRLAVMKYYESTP